MMKKQDEFDAKLKGEVSAPTGGQAEHAEDGAEKDVGGKGESAAALNGKSWACARARRGM
jgi:hypothetical protein